ncbi:MAG TPA: DUF6250 domain-containing protein [Opitutales bacterium]|nr:DUF6250 domain-containing protein [Opitutales bacterium]
MRLFRSIGCAALFVVPVFVNANSAGERLEVNGRTFTLGRIVYEEQFETDDPAFWVEGNEDRVRLEGGRLILDSNHPEDRVSTVFIDREFSGDLYFEYEAEVLASDTAAGYPEPRDVNNLNTFLYYSDPTGRDLKETRASRMDAAYSHYHDLNGYIVTFLNGYMPEARKKARDPNYEIEFVKNIARIRMRENPGFALRNEVFAEKSERGRVYRMQFIFAGNSLYFFVDDEFQLSFKPSPEKRVNKGYFAFRTYATEMAVDNFVVRRVEAE